MRYDRVFYQQLFLSLALLCLMMVSLDVKAEDITVKQAHELSSRGELLLIDIRAEREWRETGVAPQATLLSMHERGGVDALVSKLELMLEGKKDQKIALICAAGIRSGFLQDYLQKHGYTHVLNVKEGMLGSWFSDGWVKQGFPIIAYNKNN